MRLCVLGGTAPSTVALIEALRPQPPGSLVLSGRDADRLDLMVAFAQARLPCPVEGQRDPARAVEGADVVIVQIRFGGLEARARAEEAARLQGCPADETLGPGALAMGLEAAPAIEELGRLLARAAPRATVLNLINPLGLSTARLSRHLERVIGVCELPHTTAARVEAEWGAPLPWSVYGLNHRSFLVDLPPTALSTLAARPLVAGLPGDWVTELQAVPTKYHALLRRPSTPGPSRAAALGLLQGRIFAALRADPSRLPPAASERVTDWYTDGVAPLLRALQGAPACRAVNLLDADGIVRERLADVSPQGVYPRPTPPLSPAVAAWIERFEAHEAAMLRAMDDPACIPAALALDPLLAAQAGG